MIVDLAEKENSDRVVEKLSPYKVKCLDCRFDEENGMLILNCQFIEQKFQRIIFLHKSDFCFKNNPEVPDDEMHRTARLFKKYPYDFTIMIEDDINRKPLDEENYAKFVASFREQISDELGKVSDGMVDEAGQIKRHLGRLMDSGKINVAGLIESELGIRAKIGKMGER